MKRPEKRCKKEYIFPQERILYSPFLFIRMDVTILKIKEKGGFFCPM